MTSLMSYNQSQWELRVASPTLDIFPTRSHLVCVENIQLLEFLFFSNKIKEIDDSLLVSKMKCFSLCYLTLFIFFLLVNSLPNLFSFSMSIKQKWWQIHFLVKITCLLNSGQCSWPSAHLTLLKIFTVWDPWVVGIEAELMRNLKSSSKAGEMQVAKK